MTHRRYFSDCSDWGCDIHGRDDAQRVVSRRGFMKGGALALVGTSPIPAFLSRSFLAEVTPAAANKKKLVVLFQRGAVDGLNVVVPYKEKNYYSMRPSIAIQEKDVLDLNGFFGLHPSMAAMKPLYDQGHLAIIHAAGSPDPTRSHFDAQDYMESGTPGLKATPDGWLNRGLMRDPHPAPLRAVSLSPDVPRSLRGSNEVIAVGNINDFQMKDQQAAAAFKSMYGSTADRILNGTARETFEAVRIMQSIQKAPYTPANSAKYPNGRLGQSLQQIARLIKADVGLEVAFADVGGWDTHVNEAGAQPHTGQLANLLRDFGDALAAFSLDMGDRMADITLVTMSEFGRTVKENGDRGTDHGHANVMFVLGGAVRGGKVYGDWPGLARERLYEGRDLDVTTDFRTV